VGRRFQLSFCAVIIGMTGGPLAGCQQRVFVPAGPDAAVDANGHDGLAPLTLDIAVTGCATFEISALTVACGGTAPLAVSFSPVGSPELTMFLWNFGDDTPPSFDRAPLHTYTLPGSYDVTLTGGGGSTIGNVMQLRRSLIVVKPVATGAPCDVDGQCADGLHCLCQPGTGCGAAFLRGICSTTCSTGFCGAGAACASYAPDPSPDAGISNDAAAPLCLAACQTDADCSAGFVCEELLAGASTTARWVRGCLPLGAASDLGASCRNASGALDDARCTTGVCADLGTLGICTAACDGAHPCPAGAACAQMQSGQPVCLRACSTTSPCPVDPSLTCKLETSADAGTDAGTGFRIVGGDAGATYCAPS